MSDDEHFEVRERSAGVYEGTGTHLNGASVRAVGPDPDDLLKRLDRKPARFWRDSSSRSAS